MRQGVRPIASDPAVRNDRSRGRSRDYCAR
jgi:hypothetical protein